MNIHNDICAILSKPLGAIEYSIGVNIYDNLPKYGIARNFEEFADVFDGVRAAQKGSFYIGPAFDNDGRRCNVNCLPHKFAAFDLDGASSGELEDDQYAEICFQMSAWRGFRYETHSSKQGNRRARFVLELDRIVTREEGVKIRKFIRELMPKYGNWDKSCDNPAQPLFMPGSDVLIVRFGIEPLPVNKILSLIPPQQTLIPNYKNIKGGGGNVLEGLKRHGLLKEHITNKMHRIICPWSHDHSDGRTDAFYFEPSYVNGLSGGFHCFHSHCQHRNIGHLINRLDSESMDYASRR